MKSKIYVVGIGPGAYEQMTMKAANVLKSCDVIVGYTVYIDLVKEHFPEKEFLTTPMRKEVDRCILAFEEAKKGRTVAMICSGDAGVYGMSGLMYEIGEEYPGIEVEVVTGVTAAISGAGVLGAPLIHDFALISLSDLLTRRIASIAAPSLNGVCAFERKASTAWVSASIPVAAVSAGGMPTIKLGSSIARYAMQLLSTITILIFFSSSVTT